MTIFKDYAENGELLQTRDEPLSAENLQRYIKEHGITKAQGYLDAIEDITSQIEKYLSKKMVQGSLPNSAAIIARETKKMYSDHLNLLEFAYLTIPHEKKKPTI